MKFLRRRRHSDREAARTMPASVSDQLMEEVLRLGRLVDDAKFKKEVAKLGVDTKKYLADRDTPGRNPQVRAIIRRTEDGHSQVIAKGESLADGYGALLQAYRQENEFYVARWQQVRARNSRVDAQKIANEELIDLLTRARQTMERTPEAIQTLVASAGLAHFSQFLSYADLLNVFLQYPTKYRLALDAAGTLAKAALMDLAGTAFPFVGTVQATIDTIFDFAEPRINKKIEELRQATELFDHVADFGDQLTELLGYADFVDERIHLADQLLQTTHVSFTTDAAWLSAVLGNAERSQEAPGQ